MAINATSRYATSKVAPVTDAAGVTRMTILPATPGTAVYRVSYYTWRQQDRAETLAFVNYGDERLWWLIARANPEIINWFTVVPGTVIRIPVA